MAKKKYLDQSTSGKPDSLRILAIETGTNVSSVALIADGKLLALQENHGNRTHAKLITVMIARLLKDLDLKGSDLNAVAVSMGPGSYTGLRVGVSAAKGFCMALDLPLIGVGSLDALASGVSDFANAIDADICAMIDARRMEVFCQIFDANHHALTEPEAKIIEEDAFKAALDTKKLIFVGDGAEKCREILEKHPNAIVLGNRIASAALLSKIATSKYHAGDFENLITFEPYYLKNFVATISKKKIL